VRVARYIDQVIAGDEKILFDAKVHWGIYIWPTFWTVVSFGFLLPITFFWFIFALMYQLNSDFAVTNKRLIAKFGFINRTTIEQRLNKVDTIIVNQGVLGRMLNYGKVVVRGTGVSASPFGPISQPLDFKRAIEEAIEATEAK
jgi:uncharacterized membrane protein YdbT with pleckstrin-like domain